MRRDVLSKVGKDAGPGRGRDEDVRIELSTADHEEPTWDVRSPRKSRFDRRSRTILGVAALAAMLANAGAAWAYWRITEPQPAAAPGAVALDLVLRGRNDLNRTLRPGGNGDLLVTVSNEKNVPIRITTIRMGPGTVLADPEHREAGCVDPDLRLRRNAYPVSWEVAGNTVGAFTVDGALTMPRGVPAACVGATFTVPLRAQGVQR
ncbi:hypothetical protein [Actinoplanes palleronii]|uniref:Uncharacterized protein n=1 Tax=Actinoplanes palleronii TaxID=113570 RepID=A0ABQ4B3T5_9ACTN|nr:hypothetical protein [Actinoplanes palleronii]GIE65247.1 hypothetical protein Apa02nite_013550 [Actinoplanes palleronii]